MDKEVVRLAYFSKSLYLPWDWDHIFNKAEHAVQSYAAGIGGQRARESGAWGPGYADHI